MNTTTENSIKTIETPITWDGLRLNIKIKKLVSWAKIPLKSRRGDAAFDIYAAEQVTLEPMERKSISTGIALEIPPDYCGKIMPRSGLALKNGIDVMAGLIDSNFRGEVRVILINLNPVEQSTDSAFGFFGSRTKITLKQGDRIAQLLIERCENFEFEEVSQLADSDRNQSGFGSSGI